MAFAHPRPPMIRHFGHETIPALVRRQVTTTASSPIATSQVSSATQTESSTGGGLQLKLTNQASDKMYAYIMGSDSSGNMVFLQGDEAAWYNPSSTQEVDAASIRFEVAGNNTKTLTLPGYLSSGRVYIGSQEITFSWVGSLVEPSPVDSSSPNYDFPWGIIELDYTSQLCVDPSFVDSVGLALGMTVTAADGTKYIDPGLPTGALKTICAKLEAVNSDWGSLCIKNSNGELVRALSPEKATRKGSLATLYDDYIDKVWTKFESTKLTINTEYNAYGSPNVTCQVQSSNGTLVCTQPDGAVFNYQKPTTADVIGCNSGPFQPQAGGTNILQAYTWPRLCAAFTRATLLLDDGGDVTPSSQIGRSKYYTGDAVNQYAKIVHETLTEREGSGAYAFSYDDVNAPGTGENESGTFTVDSAGATMEIVIRGTYESV